MKISGMITFALSLFIIIFGLYSLNQYGIEGILALPYIMIGFAGISLAAMFGIIYAFRKNYKRMKKIDQGKDII